MNNILLVVMLGEGWGVTGQLSPFSIVTFPNGDCVSNEGIAGKHWGILKQLWSGDSGFKIFA